MKSLRCFSLFLFVVALPGSVCFSQSPRNSAAASPQNGLTVSVQELATPPKAERNFMKGTTLLLKGDPQGSVPYFRQAIEIAPNIYRFHHNLALAFYRMGQLEESGDEFQKVIDLTSGNFAPAIFGRSMILYRQGDLDHAETLVRNGLLVDPGSAIGKYCLGLVQYSLGRLIDAERSAQDAVRNTPRENDAYVLLARIHERLNNPNAVIADIQSYLKGDPHGTLQDDAQKLLQRAQADVSRLSASLK